MNKKRIEQLFKWAMAGIMPDPWTPELKAEFDQMRDLALRGLEAQSSRSQLRRTAAQKGEPMPEFGGAGEPIDIVFDGPPSHEAPRFVEVESPPRKEHSFWQMATA